GGHRSQLRAPLLLPATTETVKNVKSSSETLDDLVGLLAVTKRPREGPSLEAWKTAPALLEKKPTYAKSFESRQAAATRERLSPPPAMKKSNFCIASPAEDNGPGRKAAAQ